MGLRLAGLLCCLPVMLERGRETTGMVLKHMIEDRKGDCVREGGKKLYLNALPVSLLG